MKPYPFGPYVMLERLAIGGMAEVWLARHQGPAGFKKLVAVKRILPNIAEDQEFIQMFVEEAKIAGQLAHPAIAQIFDLGKVGQTYYIALEYVPGVDVRTLWERVRNRGGFPLAVACQVVARLCEGLDYAHRRKDARGKPLGIIHRDVSPQNVLVGYGGDVKIIDFGIAKAANRAVKTQTGILKGKFAYMAPEHARGMGMDHRADIYAIGVILHELITGERLFRAESDFSLLEKVRKGEVSSPRDARPDTPAELERIVMKALSLRPEDRYPWASHMQADLERFMVSTRRSTTREELGQFVKDHFADHHDAEMVRQQEASAAPDVAPDPQEVSEPLLDRPADGTAMFDSSSVPAPLPVPAPAPPASRRVASAVVDEHTDIHTGQDADDGPWAPTPKAPANVPAPLYKETPPTRVEEPSAEVRAQRPVALPGAVAGDAARTPRASDRRAATQTPSPPAQERVERTAIADAALLEQARRSATAAPERDTTIQPPQASQPHGRPREEGPVAHAPPPAVEDTQAMESSVQAAAPNREPSAVSVPVGRRMRLEDSGPQELVPARVNADPPAPRPRASLAEGARSDGRGLASGNRSVAERRSGRASPVVSDPPTASAQELVARRAAEFEAEASEASARSARPASVGVPGMGGTQALLGVLLGFISGMVLMVVLMRTAPLGRGTLVVKTGMATAKVTIEDRTPVTGEVVVDVLRVGKVKVTMEDSKHKTDIQLVDVSPNRITEVKYAAIPAQGSLHIITTPPGAAVTLNKERRSGVTPMVVDDMPPDGVQELVLRHPETQEERLNVETRKGETYVVEKTLRYLVSRVQVETLPDDALVLEGREVRGKKAGIKVKFGNQLTLKVMRPGCRTQEVDVMGTGAELLTPKVNLACETMDAEVTLEEPAGAHLTVDRVDTGLNLPVHGYRLPAARHRFELVSKGKVQEWEEKIMPGPQTLVAP